MAVPTLEDLVKGYVAEGDLTALRHLRQIHEGWFDRPGEDLNIGVETILKGIAAERLAVIDAAISALEEPAKQ